jgi:hypothetical protein
MSQFIPLDRIGDVNWCVINAQGPVFEYTLFTIYINGKQFTRRVDWLANCICECGHPLNYTDWEGKCMYMGCTSHWPSLHTALFDIEATPTPKYSVDPVVGADWDL